MVDETPGFLGCWALRKSDALQGKPLEEPDTPVKRPAVDVAGPVGVLPAADAQAGTAPVSADEPDAPPPEKALSLEDVKLLTKDSDFKPFMAHDVGPEVRNAAMKKLFADPHFNVMDGLDTYIDDYSKPDPIPESMLRQMMGAKFLHLFDHEEEAPVPAPAQTGQAALPRENANSPEVQSVAQSPESAEATPSGASSPEYSSQPAPLPGPGASPKDHADPHLRLQPDHAAPAPDAGRGTQ